MRLHSIQLNLYTELKIFQEGNQKLIGVGEMPKDSTSSTLTNASERYKLEETGIKQAEGNYGNNRLFPITRKYIHAETLALKYWCSYE